MKGAGDPHETTFEVTPLKVGDTLYLCTVHDHVIALDAATGQERWHFDPRVTVGHTSQHLSCRGLAYHDDAKGVMSSSAQAATTGIGATAAASIGSAANSVAAGTPAVLAAACTRRIVLPTIDASPPNARCQKS
jgi:quinoprotein glucose dehydrogenase